MDKQASKHRRGARKHGLVNSPALVEFSSRHNLALAQTKEGLCPPEKLAVHIISFQIARLRRPQCGRLGEGWFRGRRVDAARSGQSGAHGGVARRHGAPNETLRHDLVGQSFITWPTQPRAHAVACCHPRAAVTSRSEQRCRRRRVQWSCWQHLQKKPHRHRRDTRDARCAHGPVCSNLPLGRARCPTLGPMCACDSPGTHVASRGAWEGQKGRQKGVLCRVCRAPSSCLYQTLCLLHHSRFSPFPACCRADPCGWARTQFRTEAWRLRDQTATGSAPDV